MKAMSDAANLYFVLPLLSRCTVASLAAWFGAAQRLAKPVLKVFAKTGFHGLDGKVPAAAQAKTLPQAQAQAMPARRPDPIAVAMVLRTFGPGMNTLSMRNSNAGIRSNNGIAKDPADRRHHWWTQGPQKK